MVALIGVLVAFWSATSYVGGFMRAANIIYDVPEGRPLWKTVPIQLAVTAVTGVFLAVSAVSVFFTGRIAQQAGRLLGLEQQTVHVFDIAKWPVLVVGAGLLIACSTGPRRTRARAASAGSRPGSLLAVIVCGRRSRSGSPSTSPTSRRTTRRTGRSAE